MFEAENGFDEDPVDHDNPMADADYSNDPPEQHDVIQDDDSDSDFFSDDEDDLQEFPDPISHAGQEYGRGMAQKVYGIMTSTNKYYTLIYIS